MKTALVLLAAGQSKRYKGRSKKSKLLAEYKGQSLIQRIIGETSSLSFDTRILVVNSDSKEVREIGKKNGFKVIENQNPEDGLQLSVQLGIQSCSVEIDAAILCLCDMPFIKARHFSELKGLKHEDPGLHIICYYQDFPVHPVLVDRKLFQSLSKQNIRIKDLINSPPKDLKIKLLGPDEHQALDIDTIEDLANLEKI